MGNVFSSESTRGRNAEVVTRESETMNDANISHNVEERKDAEEPFEDSSNEDEARARAKEDEMIEFRRQLSLKREQRKKILTRHRTEKMELEKTLQNEIKSKMELHETNTMLRELLLKNNIAIPENLQPTRENSEITDAIIRMREEFEELKTNNNKLRKGLAESNNALQNAYSDIADLNVQHTESIKQIHALKEVVTVSKTMINLREQQLNELKDKLQDIERSLADRETNLLSNDLRLEYERQLQNIRTLRGLYEERARLAEVSRQGLVRDLEEQRVLNQVEANKCKDLSAKVENLEEKVDTLEDTIENKNIQISTCQSETRGLKAEMAVVHKLFSEVLLGYKTKQDLDTLVHRLEENHGILTHMAERENGSEASSALPKLLLELVSQVDDNEEKKSSNTTPKDESQSDEVKEIASDEIDSERNPINATAEEIVQNLPKVWKVLIELLSHQTVPDGNSPEKVTTCYKSVETKSGPVLVPSVSQTYIRLKDLILEKLGLIKEVNHMKQLNTHLETRLEEQERRLSLVTTELSKTWHVVGRLRRHHHQLHTHEKILKYELQQKRKLLNELKEELEYCREKWEQAREKNSQSEKDWTKLRAEFSSRKTKLDSPSLNNSAESGYSDERPSDESSESNDESEYVAESLLRCKKKNKKSFDTIVDSSTDFNLAAEREDPVSDMLDVADLPLDAQDPEENQETQSELCQIHESPQNEKVCIETEDEVGDISRDDICNEETSETNQCQCISVNLHMEINRDQTEDTNILSSNTSNTTSSNSTPLIDPAEILKNIKQQNERLAKKDAKLEQLEKNSASLLKKTQATAKYSDQINNTLDHLINRPTSSNINKNDDIAIKDAEPQNPSIYLELENGTSSSIQSLEINHNIECNGSIIQHNDETVHNDHESVLCVSEETIEVPSEGAKVELKNNVITASSLQENESKLPATEYNIILQEDESLIHEDDSVSETVQIVSSTAVGEETLDNLDNEQQKDNADNNAKEDSASSRDGSEAPSTSSELDHEARFAARDLRLKRLEEQTKSLVKKVNKTTTKGVKIHYKLEELHNIYGSENSRAGTPSEDIEDKNSENESQESQDE